MVAMVGSAMANVEDDAVVEGAGEVMVVVLDAFGGVTRGGGSMVVGSGSVSLVRWSG